MDSDIKSAGNDFAMTFDRIDAEFQKQMREMNDLKVGEVDDTRP